MGNARDKIIYEKLGVKIKNMIEGIKLILVFFLGIVSTTIIEIIKYYFIDKNKLKLQAELEGESAMNNIKFEISYKKKREIIDQIYKKIINTVNIFKSILLSCDPEIYDEDKINKMLSEANVIWIDMKKNYKENKLHLNEELIKGIQDFINNLFHNHILIVYYASIRTILDNEGSRRLTKEEIEKGTKRELNSIENNFKKIEEIINKHFN